MVETPETRRNVPAVEAQALPFAEPEAVRQAFVELAPDSTVLALVGSQQLPQVRDLQTPGGRRPLQGGGPVSLPPPALHRLVMDVAPRRDPLLLEVAGEV